MMRLEWMIKSTGSPVVATNLRCLLILRTPPAYEDTSRGACDDGLSSTQRRLAENAGGDHYS